MPKKSISDEYFVESGLASIYKSLREEFKKNQSPTNDTEIQPEPEKKSFENPLRSNIDQFWKNPEDLESDLFYFLKSISEKDPKLARYLINKIRQVIIKFNVKSTNPEQ